MARKALYDIRFPLGGINRKLGYRQQPPYTTPDCMNVRPAGTSSGRLRGGSRPGLEKSFYQQLGSGAKVNMLSEVDVVKTDNFTFWADYFNGTSLDDVWSQASWLTYDPNIYPENENELVYEVECGVVRDALSIDVTGGKAYTVEMYIAPYNGTHWGTYRIYARMDDTTPACTTNGIEAELTLTGSVGTYSGTLNHYASGVKTAYAFTGGATGQPDGGWFSVTITTNTIACYWQGTLLKSQAVGAAAGARVGFGMEAVEIGGICLTDQFRVQYYDSDTATIEKTRSILCAGSNGSLYAESLYGTLAAVSSSLSLASDRIVESAQRGQVLYIADHGDVKLEYGTGVIAANGVDLTSSDITDWTAHSLSTYDDVVVITNVTGSVTAGTYCISALITAKLTLTATTGGAGTCTFRIERGPKKYTPSTDALALWTATSGSGQVPTGCKAACTYRDRLVLANTTDNPHVWYMSKQGDALDWNYSADYDVVTRAVAGNIDEAGQMGEPIIALIPHTDDLLIFGCVSSMWVLRGDAAYGGQIDNLSQNIGVIGPNAWCKGPDSETYFLSRDGMYEIAPGAQSYPVSVSDEMIPDELKDIVTDEYKVSMAFDVRRGGINIFVTSILTTASAVSQSRHYWFDLDTKGFWPESYQGAHEPLIVHEYKTDAAASSGIMLGCKDGYIRKFSDDTGTDDGSLISSYIDYGPISLSGNDYNRGIINEILAVMSRNSGTVDWSIRVGDDAEAAFNATVWMTGTWSAGTNYTVRPRRRGGCFVLQIYNETRASSWEVEQITGVVKRAGKIRRL